MFNGYIIMKHYNYYNNNWHCNNLIKFNTINQLSINTYSYKT